MRRSLCFVAACLLVGCARDEEPVSTEAGPIFVDAAEQTGLRFHHFLGATGQFYMPEIMGSGVALLDYDNDGDLDVYFPQGKVMEPGKSVQDSLFPPPSDHFPGNRLFRNELVPSGKLSFTDVTDEAGVGDDGFGQGVAAADYDNDGDTDLYICNYGPNVLYRNNGDGTFIDVTQQAGVEGGSFSTSAAFVDYDQDGDLDLFVAHYNSFSVEGNKLCTAPSGEQDYCGPVTYFPLPDRLYRNEGGGRFKDVTLETGIAEAYGHGLGVICADFDNDGRVDIYVANDETPNQLWVYRDNGRFEDTGLLSGAAYNEEGDTEAGMGVSAEDFDGDGDVDIFLAHMQDESHTLYVNDGTGNFFDSTNVLGLGHTSRGVTGFGALWFDYDNDGALDLFVNAGLVMMDGGSGGEIFPYKQPNQLFRYTGNMYEDVSARAGDVFSLREVGRGAAFGDIDNDGDTDIVLANCNGPARLLLNQVGSRNHWLRLRLRGVTVNRDALGAKVALLRKGRKPVWRRVSTDGSYYSANDPHVLFGLGNNAELREAPVEAVVVVWPNGVREEWGDIKPDRQITIEEKTGH